MDAAVIGGGYAGLAAAWELVRSGARVTLYEEAAQVGGRVRGDELEGHSIDASVQLFGSSFETLFELLKSMSLSDRLVRAPGRDAVRRDGRIHTVTYGSMTSMLASGTLSARLKLKLGAKYLPFLARRARGLDVNSLATTGGPELDDESAAAFGVRELGDEFVDALVHPLLAAYYGTPADEASAALLHGLAAAGMDVRVYAARHGMAELARAVGAWLEAQGVVVRTSCGVAAVTASQDSVGVDAGDAAVRHDVAVLAVPSPVARRLVVADAGLDAWLAQVRTRPAVTLALALDRRIDADYFGLSFPARDPLANSLAAVCVQRNKQAGGDRTAATTPGDALVVMPSPSAAERLAEADGGAIVDALLPALAQVYPGIAARIVRARAYRFEHGYTIFYPGYVGRLRATPPEPASRRLALAGDYMRAPTVEGAARSGVAAARALLRLR